MTPMRKMRTAPVYFTLVQVKFNPILTLDSYVANIQEKLRKDGFPDAQKGVLATINLNLAAQADASQIPVAKEPRYTFANMERTSAFILDAGALSLQTTEYDVFDTFSATFLMGLQAVQDSIGLDYTDRIGLRYLDAVFPESRKDLTEYLSSSLLGLQAQFGAAIEHSYSESLIKQNGITLRSRVLVRDGDVWFPPELQPMNLNIAQNFRERKGRHAILDTDGWFETREKFDVYLVREHLIRIHAEIDRVFRASITEDALKAWE